ncbi:Ldh family oxidoreductase [Halosimplex amylolyticum]|uniref:Ldh family oxidoreductase n=1 Tax=Halosimplex amylolyticum TaxID=3396616 RepID=UPI003F54D3A5
MPLVEAEHLESFSRRALESYGTPPETADIVASSLVDAELVGHSSHGVVRIPYYADDFRSGTIDPTAEPTVESAGSFHQVVGGAAMGQLTGQLAVDLLVETADELGVAVVGIRDSGHLGRIGEWAERVTGEGLLFSSWVNLQGGSQRIAPPETADRRLGTNPTTFGVPTFDALPFDLIYDGATSQVAHGKIIERDGSGERLPDAWTITDSGDPVAHAADFEDGEGALLPLGGRATGYKGFGLATMAELFASIVGDGPVSTEERQDWNGNGAAFIAVDPTVFSTREALTERVARLAAHLRSAEPIRDDREVLLPGEPEYRARHERREEGIPIEQPVADQLSELAAERDIEAHLPDPLAR